MTNLELVGEESLAVISFLTFSVIEESIYLPLKDTIDEMLPSFNSGMDEALRRKVKQLKDRSQVECSSESLEGNRAYGGNSVISKSRETS